MSAVKFFFLGFPVDEKLADAIEQCDPSDRAFLEDPMYLDSIVWDECRWLGRRLDECISPEQAEDTARNVVSLISRVVPDWTAVPADALLLALDGNDPVSGIGLD